MYQNIIFPSKTWTLLAVFTTTTTTESQLGEYRFDVRVIISLMYLKKTVFIYLVYFNSKKWLKFTILTWNGKMPWEMSCQVKGRRTLRQLIDTSRGPMERSMGLSGIHGRPIWKSHFGMYSVEICSKSCEDSHGNIPWGIRLPCDVGRDFHERAHC